MTEASPSPLTYARSLVARLTWLRRFEPGMSGPTTGHGSGCDANVVLHRWRVALASRATQLLLLQAPRSMTVPRRCMLSATRSGCRGIRGRSADLPADQPRDLGAEILALTKMSWNQTRPDGRP